MKKPLKLHWVKSYASETTACGRPNPISSATVRGEMLLEYQDNACRTCLAIAAGHYFRLASALTGVLAVQDRQQKLFDVRSVKESVV